MDSCERLRSADLHDLLASALPAWRRAHDLCWQSVRLLEQADVLRAQLLALPDPHSVDRDGAEQTDDELPAGQ